MDGARLDEIDRELARLAGDEADLVARRDTGAVAVAAAIADLARTTDELRRLEASGTDERARLADAERAAGAARERLRAAETRARAAEVHRLEQRVQLDSAREALLVELAAIGPEGVEALRASAGPEHGRAVSDGSTDPERDSVPDAQEGPEAALEDALDAALLAWEAAAGRPDEPAPTAARLGALRRRYHELGSGNPFAADELAELTVRLDGLEAQRSDLEAAIGATRELITRLESLIAEQFRTTFAALEDAFGRRFQQLFDGGEAQLSLTQPDDLGATGVEITARPPGKKRQPLAMLSGGERALTAVALLLAMLEVRPVPFCVLDEVDAALDEANVARFSSALRGLAETIQFVVITHNRGTIEAADALYGVTVGDDAVSRVISLRLGDRPTVEEPAVSIPA
jgi:chromosome segregation protein